MLKTPPRYSIRLKPSLLRGRTRALVLPHAAFSYTRRVFTETLEASQIDATSIVLLSANHSQDTSYGSIENNIPGVPINEAAFQQEHSWRVVYHGLKEYMQLPKTYIMMVGSDYLQYVPKLVSLLNHLSNPLLIVSTDATHYGPVYQNEIYGHGEEAREKVTRDDEATVRSLLENRPIAQQSICGIYALRLLQILLRQFFPYAHGKWVSYDTSGDLSKQDTSVSYLGIKWDEPWLACVARIPRFVLEKKYTKSSKREWLFPPLNLPIPLGVFVTIREQGQLKGCLGTFYNNQNLTLFDLVTLYTLKTLYEDDRFQHVALRQDRSLLPMYSFEVSLLELPRFYPWSILSTVYDPCRYGVILQYKGRSATFLSSVAKEEKWISQCGKQPIPPILLQSLMRKMGWDIDDNYKHGQVYLYLMTDYLDQDQMEWIKEGKEKLTIS